MEKPKYYCIRERDKSINHCIMKLYENVSNDYDLSFSYVKDNCILTYPEKYLMTGEAITFVEIHIE